MSATNEVTTNERSSRGPISGSGEWSYHSRDVRQTPSGTHYREVRSHASFEFNLSFGWPGFGARNDRTIESQSQQSQGLVGAVSGWFQRLLPSDQDRRATPHPVQDTNRAIEEPDITLSDIFQAYDERWGSLSPTAANYPYPTRGMNANALRSRISLCVPAEISPIDDWPEETVMQSNAQTFYLAAVGLKPTYKQENRRVKPGFDKPRSRIAQVKALEEILKKERLRWHPDRLDKRRDVSQKGSDAKEAEDQRMADRVVLHAISELLDIVRNESWLSEPSEHV